MFALCCRLAVLSAVSVPVLATGRAIAGASGTQETTGKRTITVPANHVVVYGKKGRFGGWPAYLERPSDFVRFCCYLHVTETLAARGGTGDARVVYRWPIRRYER